MHPDRFSANPDEYVSVVFTAKESGIVRITDKLEYTGGDAGNPLKIRIRKISDGTSTLMVTGQLEFEETADINVLASLSVGDKVCFEAANAGTPIAGKATVLKLNPTIAYQMSGGIEMDKDYVEPDITDLMEGRAYTAFERFSTTLTDNGKQVYAWGNDGELVWKPYLSNTEGDLTLLTSISFGQFTKESSNNAAVGAGMIHPDRTMVNPDEFAAMAFVAPKAGLIKIADTLKYSTGDVNNAFNIRIRKVSRGKSTPVFSGKLAVGGTKDILFCAEVEVGDMILFEVANTAGMHPAHRLDLNPVITYMTDIPTYTASAAFNLETNGDGIWSWEYFDVADGKFKTLEKSYEYFEGAWEPEYSNKQFRGRAWAADGGEFVTAAAGYTLYSRISGVGKYTILHPPTNNDTYGVKSFTAPKSGKVTLSHNGSPYAMQGTYGAENYLQQSYAKIIKISVDGTETQIWPVDITDKPVMQKKWRVIGTFGGIMNPDKSSGFTFTKDDLKALKDIDLIMGDQLKFIASRNGEYNASPGIVWDPVVEYTELYPAVESTNTERFAENVPPARDLVLSFNQQLAEIIAAEDVTVKKIVDGVDTETDAVCSDVVFDIDGDGKTILTISFDGMETNTTYGVYINDIMAADGESATMLKWVYTTGESFITYEPAYSKTTKRLSVGMYNSGEATDVILMVLTDNGAYFNKKTDVVKEGEIGVNIGDVSGETVKAVLIDGVDTFRPISDIMTLEVK